MRELSNHRGWLIVLAASLVPLTGAGIYAMKGRSGIERRDARPAPPDHPGPNPNPELKREIKADAGDAPLSTREIVARCEASVAQINGRFAGGSGFLVGPGLLATNAHVIAGEIPGDLRVYFPSRGEAQKGPYRATLIDEDILRDLAILKADVPFPSLPLASPYRFRRGEDVTIIGSPGVNFAGVTLENAVSRGVLSTETVILGRKYYQLGASVNHGNSGGPVIGPKGEVVGVVTLKAGEESIGFCIPVDDLATAIDRARLATPEEVRARVARHGAIAVYRSLIARGLLCAAAIRAQSKRIEGVLALQDDADGLTEALKENRERLALRNTAFDDGYRVAVSDLLIDPALPADVRRDLRDLWSTCDDMNRLAIDPRPNLGRFRDEADSLMTQFADIVTRLKPRLGGEGR